MKIAEGSMSRTNAKNSIFYDADILAQDKRLNGWKPSRRVQQSKGSIQITRLVEQPPSSLFDRRDVVLVYYSVTKRDGSVGSKRITFERDRRPDLGNIAAVSSYLCEKIGRGTFEKVAINGPLVELPKSISSRQDKELLAALPTVLRFINQLQDKPTEESARRVRARAKYAIDQAFKLGMIARELELLAFERDAIRARRSAVGSAKGAKRSGSKRAEHANAWKRRFAGWLQPLLESEVRARKTALSRDAVAKYVVSHWPKGGFIGTYDRQELCPEWSTLIATLKSLEKQGFLTRRPAKRGRKSA